MLTKPGRLLTVLAIIVFGVLLVLAVLSQNRKQGPVRDDRDNHSVADPAVKPAVLPSVSSSNVNDAAAPQDPVMALNQSLDASKTGSVGGAAISNKAPGSGVVHRAPPLPKEPASAAAILAMQEFSLENSYQTDWHRERPVVKSGTILVLKVNPDLVYPRQTAEPVLYAGQYVAERINRGYPSGVVVVIVPGKIDPERDLIWFGSPDLPERVDDSTIQKERERAQAAGLKPLGPVQVTASVGGGGSGVGQVWRGRSGLLSRAGELILKYAPDEAQLGEKLKETKDLPGPKDG